jgi:hypothetical protein
MTKPEAPKGPVRKSMLWWKLAPSHPTQPVGRSMLKREVPTKKGRPEEEGPLFTRPSKA